MIHIFFYENVDHGFVFPFHDDSRNIWRVLRTGLAEVVAVVACILPPFWYNARFCSGTMALMVVGV